MKIFLRFIGTESLIEYAIKYAKETKLLNPDDACIVIHGSYEGNPEQSDLLKIVHV